ncbi:hypothetical protein cce_3449 [Crocosphaera subtropica ATCC 51142]|uniref:PEP-CTERM protein-sorting domain-containing protein n=2 Tax=Crocosphaera TaxID=263510 RepID=B1WZ33_CROS5|nr:hypothetical protein cce_3449 [Crocosphaera subtropica ATCC 51142]
MLMIKKTSVLSSVALGSLLALSLTQTAQAAVFDFSWNNSGGTFEDTPSRDSELGDGLSASGTITLDDAVGDGSSFTIADITAYSIEVFNGTTSLFTFTDVNSANFAGATFLPTTIEGTLSGNALSFSRFSVTTAQNYFGCGTEFSFNAVCTLDPFIHYDDDGSFVGNSLLSNTNISSLAYSYGSFPEAFSSFELTLQDTGVVPEPLTILGAATAIGFGASFKRKLAQRNKKQG